MSLLAAILEIMGAYYNPKILGAIVFGLALVTTAYLGSDFMQQQPADAGAVAPVTGKVDSTVRTSISVADSDQNGIEDWRDEFVTTEAITLPNTATSSEYTRPDTLTGQMAIEFMEGVISSKIYGGVAASETAVVEQTSQNAAKRAQLKLHDLEDIFVTADWTNTDIVMYGNALADSLYRHSVPELADEITILNDVLRNENEERLPELEILAGVYAGYVADALAIPVPQVVAKEHLDLINTMKAVEEDIAAMSLVYDDPALALLHIKRYRGDALGMTMALENMYQALEPFADSFTVNDSAVLFVQFSPDLQN